MDSLWPIFIIVGLVLFGITVWGVVDALQRPDAVWLAAGQNKTTWVVL
ncbi:MAG: hypothetical protein QOJ69_1606, partial [Actinomycetota bacterium]|nr:hypothetical protein [Actinomycetota bacterium]